MIGDLPVRIRDPHPDDINYIIKCWAREFRYYFPKHLPDRLYYQEQQKVIGQLASKSILKVACAPDNLSAIYGFAVGKVQPEASTLLLHYVYTRAEWRRLGIAKALVHALGYTEGMEVVATHWSNQLSKITEDRRMVRGKAQYTIKYPFLIFNPFLMHGLMK